MYDSFGITLSLSGTKADANPYWFSSQLYDADTDFYHYQRRVYVPAWQRFLNRDPIEEMGGINLFGFVDNGPINRIDPFGLREDNEHDWLAPSYAYTHPAIPLNTEPRPTLILYPNNFVGSLPPNAMYQWAYEAEGTGIHEDGAGYLLVPGGGLYGRLTSSGAKLCAAKATAPIEKFSHYLFKEGATHGKDKVFRSLGYNAKDSAQLAKLWEKQASAKYAQGNYTLGKLNQYGQHINITIDVPGVGVAAGKTRSVTSGWMINVCETKFRWFVVSRLFFA